MLYMVYGHRKGYRGVQEIVEDEATADRKAKDWVEEDDFLYATYTEVDGSLLQCPRGCGHVGIMHGVWGCEGVSEDGGACACKKETF